MARGVGCAPGDDQEYGFSEPDPSIAEPTTTPAALTALTSTSVAPAGTAIGVGAEEASLHTRQAKLPLASIAEPTITPPLVIPTTCTWE